MATEQGAGPSGDVPPQYVTNSGKIVSKSDKVTLYPLEGTNGEGFTSEPPKPSATPDGGETLEQCSICGKPRQDCRTLLLAQARFVLPYKVVSIRDAERMLRDHSRQQEERIAGVLEDAANLAACCHSGGEAAVAIRKVVTELLKQAGGQ